MPVNRATFCKYAKGVAAKVDGTQAEYLLDFAIKDPTTVAEVLQLFNQGYVVITEANAAKLRRANQALGIDTQLALACDCVAGKSECPELRASQLQDARAINATTQTELDTQRTENERLQSQRQRSAAIVERLQRSNEKLEASKARIADALGKIELFNGFKASDKGEDTVAKSKYAELKAETEKLEEENQQLSRTLDHVKDNETDGKDEDERLQARSDELEQQLRGQREVNEALVAENGQTAAALQMESENAQSSERECEQLAERYAIVAGDLLSQRRIVSGMQFGANADRRNVVVVSEQLAQTVGTLRAEVAAARVLGTGTIDSNVIRETIARMEEHCRVVTEHSQRVHQKYEHDIERLEGTHTICFSKIEFDFVAKNVDENVNEGRVYSAARFNLSVTDVVNNVAVFRELECLDSFHLMDMSRGVTLRVHMYDANRITRTTSNYVMQQAADDAGHEIFGKLVISSDAPALILTSGQYRIDVLFYVRADATEPLWTGYKLIDRPTDAYSIAPLKYIGIQSGVEQNNYEPTNDDCTPIWDEDGSIVEAITVAVVPREQLRARIEGGYILSD